MVGSTIAIITVAVASRSGMVYNMRACFGIRWLNETYMHCVLGERGECQHIRKHTLLARSFTFQIVLIEF